MGEVAVPVRIQSALAAVMPIVYAAGCGDGPPATATAPITPLLADVPMPDVRRGDFWEYEAVGGDAPSRSTLEVVQADGGGRFRANATGPAFPGATQTVTRIAEYDGPWNPVQPDPAWSRVYLKFPLRQGARWTSTARGPGEMTWSLAQEVKGSQTLTLAGAKVECVRVEGTETTTSTVPPPASVVAKSTLWYCPAVRGVGRVETVIPNAAVVTQSLVAFRSGIAP